MSAIPPRKSSQAQIDRAAAWNLANRERRREILLKSYLKLGPPKRLPIHERFDQRYIPVPESGCWLWLGPVNRGGYGKLSWKLRDWTAHRLAWTLFKGEIPDSICVLHRCDVPSCVNPDHLFLGTNRDNTEDRQKKGRQAKWERNARAILTESQVVAIRAMKGMAPYNVIADKFGISATQTSDIIRGKSWKEIT